VRREERGLWLCFEVAMGLVNACVFCSLSCSGGFCLNGEFQLHIVPRTMALVNDEMARGLQSSESSDLRTPPDSGVVREIDLIAMARSRHPV